MPRRTRHTSDLEHLTVEELRDRIRQLHEEHGDAVFDSEARDEWTELNARVDELETRRQRVAELYRDERNHDVPHDAARPRTDDSTLSRALRCNERAEFLPEAARAHMERMLRTDNDPHQGLAKYTQVASDRAYFRAFSAVLNDPVSGSHTWTPAEREAVREVNKLRTTLALGGTGSYLVPYEIDPQITVTASYKDPLREISRVETTAQNSKRYVTSAGSTSSWDPESTEVSDDTPVLAEVPITCKKAMTFAAVTFEVYEDSDIAQQIAQVFAESKAAHESLSFTLTQSNGPVGLVSAIVAAGGTSVLATGSNVLAGSDVLLNDAALPARWRSNASWMAHQSIINGYRGIIKGTGLTESIVDDSSFPPRLLNRPLYENSNMDGTLTGAAADYTLLHGDFSQYVIQDRVGTSIELVPHLLGATRRPSGERGFLQHWRVGADVLVPGAFVLTNHST